MLTAIAVVLGLNIPFAADAKALVVIERRTIGAWSLEIDHTKFTGQTRCRLQTRDMALEGPALVFEFPKHVDTSAAWFRIDSEQARPWRSLIPGLLFSGVRLQTESMANPSQGRVPILAAQIEDAGSVTIAPEATARPKIFKLHNFNTAKAAAEALGCRFDPP